MPLEVSHAFLPGSITVLPFFTIWSRLEVLPTTADYAPALEARIADPLWLLGRQWQFGEFQGEDAGTPIQARLEIEHSRLDRYQPGAADDPARPARDYAPAAAPLEALVEAEPASDSGLFVGVMAGLHFLRILKSAGLPDTFSDDPRFALAPIDPDAAVDAGGAAWLSLFAGRAIDGHALAAAIAAASGVPSGIAATAALKQACLDWLDWYRGGLPADAGSAWVPDRLEHAFAAAAGKTGEKQALTAAEYADGALDWYSFDVDSGRRLGGTAPAKPLKLPPFLPTPARFPGMPSDRYWEFEDGRVNLAQVTAGPTDLGKLLMLDFALAYGNDWYQLPLELPVGAIAKVLKFRVVDTFGIDSGVPRGSSVGGSRFFELSGDAGSDTDLLTLAPVVAHRLEGDPIEEVALFRDEMANLAWAVERKVQGDAGLPIDRYREASVASASHRLADLDGIAPDIIYRVATGVPEHWIPLVPVARTGQPLAEFEIQLERRAMLRPATPDLPPGTDRRVHPKGRILRTDTTLDAASEPPLALADEEVPRSGVVVTRRAQFTRWVGGERLHWIGRRKEAARGEGSSGLRFDVLLRKQDLAGASDDG